MDAKFASTKERWMPNLRQQTRRQLIGLVQLNNSQIVPKNGLLYVQVNYKYIVILQVKSTDDFASDYKCI